MFLLPLLKQVDCLVYFFDDVVVNLKNNEIVGNELKIEYETSKRKENQFNEKIDELNQETDSLLEEIDKWQM